MEIKLQESFKYEIIGKSLEEYINRKDSSGYHEVSMEQFATVASAVLHALERNEDFMSNMLGKNIDEINCEDSGKLYLRNDELEKLADKLKDLVDLDEAALEIDDILYKKIKPIKEVIRDKINSYVSVGSSYIKLNGDIKNDTIKMFDYAMNCNDIYDKAYVMQSVVDRVLEIYFKTLKKVKEDN